MPTISVIIPTHNRVECLQRTLAALKNQSYPAEETEVIVVADGCNDETIDMLHRYKTPFTLRSLEQSGQGAATARNKGAAIAEGSLLIFLDDDIEAAPQLIEAHVYAHKQQANSVIMGYLPPMRNNQASFFDLRLWLWWEDQYQAMCQPSHRFRYCNLFSGNFSIPTELFKRAGEFDQAFILGNEDYELGARLIKIGANFGFAPEAWGHHHDISDFDRILKRKYKEGKTSVQLGQKHPDLIPILPITGLIESRSSLSVRILLTLVSYGSPISDFVAGWLRISLDWLERIRAWGYWKQLQDILFGYWHLRGVLDACDKKYSKLIRFLQNKPTDGEQNLLEIELDLLDGLATAEDTLDKQRPTSVRIRYGQQPVGYVPLQPGSERLRGAHLKPILATTLAAPLLQALALSNTEDVSSLDESRQTYLAARS